MRVHTNPDMYARAHTRPQAIEIYVFPKTQRNFRLVAGGGGGGGDGIGSGGEGGGGPAPMVPPHCLRPVRPPPPLVDYIIILLLLL